MSTLPLPVGVVVPISADIDIIGVRQATRKLAAELGFSASDRTLLATAVSELARNIVQYARFGTISLRAFEHGDRCGLMLLAEDDGPGIADLQLALRDGYSTSGGLGLGLPGVQRLMDGFEIHSSPGGGTRIRAVKYLPNGRLTGLAPERPPAGSDGAPGRGPIREGK